MYNLHEAYLDVYEEDDKRRAPKELLDRLNNSREGWMAQDGPNRPAYEARQRLLTKAWERKNQTEEVDIYDIILSYLLDEGYADTEQAAEKIMLVMSEEWVNNILNESDSAENEEKERTRNNSTQLSRLRREIRQLGAQGKPVPMELRKREAELGRQVRLASNAAAALNKDKPKPRTVPGLGDTPQTPSTGSRAPRQRRSDETTPETQQANSILGSSVERGATHVIRTSDGKTMRVALNSTRPPIQIRTDATRSERRSGTSRPIDRPEVGRDLGPEKSAENAPTSFRRKPR